MFSSVSNPVSNHMISRVCVGVGGGLGGLGICSCLDFRCRSACGSGDAVQAHDWAKMDAWSLLNANVSGSESVVSRMKIGDGQGVDAFEDDRRATRSYLTLFQHDRRVCYES